MSPRALFAYFDGCEVLDFAGPLQALHEVNALVPSGYRIHHCATAPEATTAQGLRLTGLEALLPPQPGDLLFVPGFTVGSARPPAGLGSWVGTAVGVGARVFSICTGAFVLARAGLLRGRHCTTHWKRTAELRAAAPGAHVVADRLFVRDGPITTSAGIAAGIDMTLDLIEQDHGPLVASRVAREMVVYLRRDGGHDQQSVYLAYRTHLDPGVHAVQDFLVSHPADRSRLDQIAGRAHMSVRNLSRAFARATGLSVGAFRTRVRLEHARMLLANASLTLDAVAAQAGFDDPRQLRRHWHRQFGEAPGRTRRRLPAEAARP